MVQLVGITLLCSSRTYVCDGEAVTVGDGEAVTVDVAVEVTEAVSVGVAVGDGEAAPANTQPTGGRGR